MINSTKQLYKILNTSVIIWNMLCFAQYFKDYMQAKRIYGKDIIISIDDLSKQKHATQSHTYPGAFYNASNAVDGNPSTCMRTLPIGNTNPDKTAWWKVDLGGVYSIYGISIVFKDYKEDTTGG